MKPWDAERIGTVIFGVALAVLGLFIGVETVGMNAGPQYAAVGPRAFPAAVAIGLLVIAAVLVRGALAGGAAGEGAAPRHDWSAVLWIAGTLVLQFLLLPWIGWIPAATLVFVGVTQAMGNRRLGPTVLLGLALAGATYVLFNHVLGLSLPAGELFEALKSPA